MRIELIGESSSRNRGPFVFSLEDPNGYEPLEPYTCTLPINFSVTMGKMGSPSHSRMRAYAPIVNPSMKSPEMYTIIFPSTVSFTMRHSSLVRSHVCNRSRLLRLAQFRVGTGLGHLLVQLWATHLRSSFRHLCERSSGYGARRQGPSEAELVVQLSNCLGRGCTKREQKESTRTDIARRGAKRGLPLQGQLKQRSGQCQRFSKTLAPPPHGL